MTHLFMFMFSMLFLAIAHVAPAASVAAELSTPAPEVVVLTDVEPVSHVVLEHEERSIDVPFYSQFEDITSPTWQKVGCGIASLAMIIEYHKPQHISVDALLEEGIEEGAYSDAGWTYKGLIDVSRKYGFSGESHDLAGSSSAFSEFEKAVQKGPVIASVYYTFEPGNPIPHLVVVSKIEGDRVYYNDPAEPQGGGSISTKAFKAAWKERYIEVYPLS